MTLDGFFHCTERGSSLGTEVRAGVTTFLMMAYIIVVNPQILAETGMPLTDVVTATALAAAIACLVMGLVANFPFALAPGMGLNAFFTYGVVLGTGIAWQTALAAAFVAGVLFLVLSNTGLRSKVINSIPNTLKLAVTSGIGLFLAIIGFKNMGLSVDHPATLITRGSIIEPSVYLSVVGVLLIGALMTKGVRGAILIGVTTLTVIFWIMGIAAPPEGIIATPHFPSTTLFALDFENALTIGFMMAVFSFLFVDVLDTAGTLIGVGRAGQFLDDQGRLPGAERAFLADATGTAVGALVGTSPVTSYIESAAGIKEGGRTGLTAIVVALLFLLAMFFLPVIVAVPLSATGPALVVVGAMMMEGTRDIDWQRIEDAIPAFLTIATMPFTYSIADAIGFGIVSYTAIRLMVGRYREVSGVMYTLAAVLLVYFAVIG